VKKYLITFLFLSYPIFSYSVYTFINSSPIQSEVSILTKAGKKIKMGRTPIKTTNFQSNMTLIFKKSGYTTVTNKVPKSKKNQNIDVILSPLSFQIQFPNPEGGHFFVDKEPYTSLDGTLLLPYGNYNINYDMKKNALQVAYKSPYIPYVAFFSTVTILSTIMVITGAVLGSKSFEKYHNSSTPEQAIYNLEQTTLWDTVTWTGVGLSTAGIIGTAITAGLEVKEKKRIKRFNGMNKSTENMDCFSMFQEILLLSSADPNSALNKINQFIKNFEASRFLPEIFLKRASIFILQNKLSRAKRDLNLIINKYPTEYSYEMATKLLGDIFSQEENYKQAYNYYKESINITKIYPYNNLKIIILNVLYELALDNNKYIELYLQESKDIKKLDKKSQLEIQEKIKELKDLDK